MEKKFRAILLAAGLGTRLRPITDDIQKCLLPINGKPLLQIWLDDLSKAGCDAVIVNTHYKHKQVEDFLSKLTYENMRIITVYEDILLGTAGTLITNKDFFEGATGLLIHADNFSTANIQNFLESHFERDPLTFITMLTFNSDNPTQVGIIEKNEKGVMIGFHEKCQSAPGNIANGAVYAFDNNFLSWLDKNCKTAFDFSLEILPKLINKVQTHHTNDIYIDIGLPESLERARKIAINKVL